MRFILILSIMALVFLTTGCNAPGGSTSVINSKSTAIPLPKDFQFSGASEANGTVVFNWQA